MQQFSTAPAEMIASLWRNRGLIVALVGRDVAGRYRGSMLGLMWSLFHPIFMLGVYTFVFGVVFRARWDQGGESKYEFAVVLFVGLMVFNLFSECVTRAPTLIIANVNYVKKVVFPLEILPWVVMGSALFHLAVSLVAWLIFHTTLFGVPQSAAVLFPLILAPLIFFTMGLSWILASLGVFLRDVTQVVGIATTALLFLSPIFYPLSSLPPEFVPLLRLNPLTPAVEQARALLLWGRLPEGIALQIAAAALTAVVGFAWFQKTRKGFADVL